MNLNQGLAGPASGLSPTERRERIRENNEVIRTNSARVAQLVEQTGAIQEVLDAADRGDISLSDDERDSLSRELRHLYGEAEVALIYIKFARIDNRALRRVRYEDPDSIDTAPTTITSAVDAHFLYHRLKSLGGLGFAEASRESARIGRLPNILRAVDPAPDSDSGYSSEINSLWQTELFDPVP